MYKIFFENETELKEAELYDNFEFSNFCISESDRLLKELRLNQINIERGDFEKKLKKILFNIKTSYYISKNSNNDNIETINKSLSTLRDNIDLHFRANYSDIINWHKPSSLDYLFESLTSAEKKKVLSKSYLRKDIIEGSQEYFDKHKLNEIFCDFNSYKIFFDFMNLFIEDGKIEFNYTDACFLFRVMFEKKYIIESVSESTFRFKMYDSKKLNFEKLKSLKASTSIYRRIIFAFIEKQNRSQKIFYSPK